MSEIPLLLRQLESVSVVPNGETSKINEVYARFTVSVQRLLRSINFQKQEPDTIHCSELILERVCQAFIGKNGLDYLAQDDLSKLNEQSSQIQQAQKAFDVIDALVTDAFTRRPSEKLEPSTPTCLFKRTSEPFSQFPATKAHSLIKAIKNDRYGGTNLAELTREAKYFLQECIKYQQQFMVNDMIFSADCTDCGLIKLQHLLLKQDWYRAQWRSIATNEVVAKFDLIFEFYKIEKSCAMKKLEENLNDHSMEQYLTEFFAIVRSFVSQVYGNYDASGSTGLSFQFSWLELLEVTVEVLAKLMNVLYDSGRDDSLVFEFE